MPLPAAPPSSFEGSDDDVTSCVSSFLSFTEKKKKTSSDDSPPAAAACFHSASTARSSCRRVPYFDQLLDLGDDDAAHALEVPWGRCLRVDAVFEEEAGVVG
ncbi:hypothetical protein PG994_002393 [Apiospora phragmitis]|uniref:Uncharacterized protein n=1 Tax=Apiospora phragmitis TaxID=2905665 RepID=A0ABR1WW79_9PEZI